MPLFQYSTDKESWIKKDYFGCGIAFALLVETNIYYENTFS